MLNSNSVDLIPNQNRIKTEKHTTPQPYIPTKTSVKNMIFFYDHGIRMPPRET